MRKGEKCWREDLYYLKPLQEVREGGVRKPLAIPESLRHQTTRREI